MRLVRLRRWVVRPVLVLMLAASGFVGWNMATGNFATVRPGRIYRSGQLRAADLGRIVRDHRIKTVLNLRGSHPDQPWYRAERSTTLAAGATQIDMAMSSCEWMSRDQARILVRVLDTCEYPLLIHCWRGAERTGWVSAISELLRPGSTLDDARGQFALKYLFVRAGDGALMLDHLERYEQSLRARDEAHTPDRFRRWMDAGYQPGRPSREQWPFDPYPLVVVSRPAPSPAPAADRLAGALPSNKK
jgi:protein tyrosine phosphatase (PTP) superfamily phosphohydrolase (DUF442 family)